nr:hypothetical protein GCM10020093_043720 [Planobispora longispora]
MQLSAAGRTDHDRGAGVTHRRSVSPRPEGDAPPALGTGRTVPAPSVAEAPQVGVEEEFFLFDPRTGRTAPRAARIMAEVRRPDRVQREFAACQIETASSPHTDLGALRRELVRLRSELSGAARREGCRLTACGSAPFEHSASDAPVADEPRYRRIARVYGAIARGEKCCGCHVHVEVPDREEAVQVCNHLRPWFPTLLALTANSPSPPAATADTPAGGRSPGDAGPPSARRRCSAPPPSTAPPWTR